MPRRRRSRLLDRTSLLPEALSLPELAAVMGVTKIGIPPFPSHLLAGAVTRDPQKYVANPSW